MLVGFGWGWGCGNVGDITSISLGILLSHPIGVSAARWELTVFVMILMLYVGRPTTRFGPPLRPRHGIEHSAPWVACRPSLLFLLLIAPVVPRVEHVGARPRCSRPRQACKRSSRTKLLQAPHQQILQAGVRRVIAGSGKVVR